MGSHVFVWWMHVGGGGLCCLKHTEAESCSQIKATRQVRNKQTQEEGSSIFDRQRKPTDWKNIEGIEEFLLPVEWMNHTGDSGSAQRGDVRLIELVHTLEVILTLEGINTAQKVLYHTSMWDPYMFIPQSHYILSGAITELKQRLC